MSQSISEIEYQKLQSKVESLEKKIEKLKEKLSDANESVMFLTALESAGVDNWPGYTEAVKIYKDMIDETS